MKVHALALGTGYAESASYSQLILVHLKGFPSIQEALCNIRDALVTMIAREIKDHNWFVESQNRFRASHGAEPVNDKISSENPENLVAETLYEIIHGNYQDHGDFWEDMNSNGWYVGMAWVANELHRYELCFIDNAPEWVESAPNWRYNSEEGKVLGTVSNGDDYLIHPSGYIPDNIRLYKTGVVPKGRRK